MPGLVLGKTKGIFFFCTHVAPYLVEETDIATIGLMDTCKTTAWVHVMQERHMVL